MVRSHDTPSHIKQNTGEYLGSYKIFVSKQNKDKKIYEKNGKFGIEYGAFYGAHLNRRK
jgi:hypothetical protein